MLAPLNDFLHAQVGEQGAPRYALIPQRLPAVSFHAQYQSQLILHYLDEHGTPVSPHYDGAGKRLGLDGSLESTLAQDFLQAALAQRALVPAWEAETIRAHLINDPEAWKEETPGSGLAQEHEDGLRQTFSVLTLELGPPKPPHLDDASGRERIARFNLDADAYFGRTQWV